MLNFFAFYDMFFNSFAVFPKIIWEKGVKASPVKWATNLTGQAGIPGVKG
jgi:hypothetical protein